MRKESALPKNIRQIGEVPEKEKLCMEDYVMTYIRKKEPQEEQGYLGVLLGERKEGDSGTYVFIRGILEVPAQEKEPDKIKEQLESDKKNYFRDWEVQGCCVIGTYPTMRLETLAGIWPETGQLIYHLQEQEETVYWRQEGKYERLKGFFVFYEQNRKMQAYLTDTFGEKSVEKEGVQDQAIKNFRKKVKEKGERKAQSFLKLASSFFVITVLIIGAVVVNRLDEIQKNGLPDRNTAGQQTAYYEAGQTAGSNQSSGSALTEVSGGTAEIVTVNDTVPAAENASADTALTAGNGGSNVAAGEAALNTDTASVSGKTAAADGDGAAVSSDGAALSGDGAAVSSDGAALSGAGTAVSSDGAALSGAGAAVSSAGAAVNGDAAAVSGMSGDSQEVLAGSDAFWNETFEDMADPAQDVSSAAAADGSQESTGQENISGEGTSAQEASSRQIQAAYIIREGDTLADISRKYYGNMEKVSEICDANGITDPNMILPGDKIVLP